MLACVMGQLVKGLNLTCYAVVAHLAVHMFALMLPFAEKGGLFRESLPEPVRAFPMLDDSKAQASHPSSRSRYIQTPRTFIRISSAKSSPQTRRPSSWSAMIFSIVSSSDIPCSKQS